MSLLVETIPKGNGFKFDAHSVCDRNYRARFEYKCGKHEAKTCEHRWDHRNQSSYNTPITHPDNEQLDLEIGGGLPLSENLQNALLGILVLNR